MRLGIRILLGFFVIFIGAFYYLTKGFMRDIRYRYLEGVEDVLVDQAQILAAQVSRQMEAGAFSAEEMRRIFNTAYTSPFTAQIYQLEKTHVDLRVYITDDRGIVIFDSKDKAVIGKNYAKWRDVRLTLQGEYGARSSDADPNDPYSTVLHVAAPLKVRGKIAGVLTVCKPTTNINHFLELAKSKLTRKSVLAGLCVLVLSTALILWIVWPIKSLTRYADNVRQGKKAALPRLDRSEIGDMGRAFDRMREALEGKKYVEHYIQTLTHELKSPISAIQGAAELLEEEMPHEQRTRFLTNICKETDRVKQLIDRMLFLSSLENKQEVEKPEPLEFNPLLSAVIERFHPIIQQKSLDLTVNEDEGITIMGDAFLIKQSIANLIQNAIDFSPHKGQVAISAKKESGRLVIKVTDQGPGIPDFAKERLFEKFFSTRRPVTGDKSTGLGLNFVQKIIDLHNGTIHLENLPSEGARAILTLPLDSA